MGLGLLEPRDMKRLDQPSSEQADASQALADPDPAAVVVRLHVEPLANPLRIRDPPCAQHSSAGKSKAATCRRSPY